jgi:hypothetical protein
MLRCLIASGILLSIVAALAAQTVGQQPSVGTGPPATTEEQIEARLRELRKQLDALRAEEQKLRQQLEQAKTAPRGYIKAEVTGVLRRRDEGGGYYIAIRPADAPKRETRVWLWISEDKETVRKLEGLTGREVVARGLLEQLPEGVQAIVPPGGMYLQKFEIEAADRPLKEYEHGAPAK